MTGRDAGAGPAEANFATEVEGFISDVEAERLRLYRRHLQLNVRRASPLVMDVAVFAGFRLEEIAWALMPPAPWPWYDERRHRALYALPKGSSAGAMYRPTVSGKGRDPTGLVRRRGMVVCAPAGRADEIAFAVLGKGIEILATLGGAALQTGMGVASLLLPETLPESLATILPGRRLDEVVSHPVLDGRGYAVEGVTPTRDGNRHVVTFRTGLLPFDLPWTEVDRDPS